MAGNNSQGKTEIHVVTGGGGYAGFRLGKKLAELGHSVRLIDVNDPIWDLSKGMTFYKGSITDEEFLYDKFQGADVVYHLASFGMSGREQLNKKKIEFINVRGTEAVLNVCKRCNVTRLVYTSTYNVVFYGQEIENGDDNLPYVPNDKFTDHYSKTKMMADKKVMAANGQTTADGSLLRTCALRLAGVYGPGEQRHLPRIVNMLEMGFVLFTFGRRDSLVDFLHVDNLVQGHVLAAQALVPDKGHVAAGKVYCLSDKKPINNFEFFRQLFEGLGYTYPKINLPLWIVFYIAWVIEMVHAVVSPFYNFQPLLTRTEVYKSGMMHHFSIKGATNDLGYRPTIQNDLSEVVTHYRKLGRVKGAQSSAIMYYLVNALIVAIIYYLLIYFLPRVTAYVQ